MRRLRRCGRSSATSPGNCRATCGSSLSAARDAHFPPASICRWRGATAILRLARSGALAGGGVRGTDRRLPGGVHLAAPAVHRDHRRRAGPCDRRRIPARADCDLRVLADDAQFSMAEVTLGLVPDLGGTKRLAELVGHVPGAGDLRDRPADRRGRGRPDRPGHRGRARAPTWTRPVRDLAAAVLAGDRDAVVEIKALLAGAAGRVVRRAGPGRAGGADPPPPRPGRRRRVSRPLGIDPYRPELSYPAGRLVPDAGR